MDGAAPLPVIVGRLGSNALKSRPAACRPGGPEGGEGNRSVALAAPSGHETRVAPLRLLDNAYRSIGAPTNDPHSVHDPS